MLESEYGDDSIERSPRLRAAEVEPWDKADFERWLKRVREHHRQIIEAHGGYPFTTDELDEMLHELRERRD